MSLWRRKKSHVICGAESKIVAMASFHFKWKSLQLTVQEQSKKKVTQAEAVKQMMNLSK